MKFLWMSLIILLPILVSAGGYVVGNPGTVVIRDGKAYLVDLEDMGIPVASHAVLTKDLRIEDQLRKVFLDKDFESTRPLLAHKIAELNQQWPVLGDIFTHAFSAYQWQFVAYPLLQREDQGIFLRHSGEALQVANRFSKTVRIQRQLWLRMPLQHRAALLFHEILSALLIKKADDFNALSAEQDARIKEVTGSLFIEASKNYSRQDLVSLFRSDFDLPLKTISKVTGADQYYRYSTGIRSYANNFTQKLVLQSCSLPCQYPEEFNQIRQSNFLSYHYEVEADEKLFSAVETNFCKSAKSSPYLYATQVRPAFTVLWLSHIGYDSQIAVVARDPREIQLALVKSFYQDEASCKEWIKARYKELY